jgi:hypothetical protein
MLTLSLIIFHFRSAISEYALSLESCMCSIVPKNMALLITSVCVCVCVCV